MTDQGRPPLLRVNIDVFSPERPPSFCPSDPRSPDGGCCEVASFLFF